MTKLMRANCLRLALFVLLPATAGCQRLSTATETRNAPDPSNELPFGFIDSPPNGAIVDRQLQLYGWALDDQGVAEVRLFIDGHFVKSAAMDQARPDVVKAYAGYTSGRGDKHGWAATLPLGAELATGSSHMIIAQAVDTKGATRDIGTITVTIGQ